MLRLTLMVMETDGVSADRRIRVCNAAVYERMFLCCWFQQLKGSFGSFEIDVLYDGEAVCMGIMGRCSREVASRLGGCGDVGKVRISVV
jgi:hypothetical protein